MDNVSIKFYGFDIIKYYWYTILRWFEGYSIQVKIAYGIVFISILVLLILMITFFIKHHKRSKINKHQEDINDKYYDKIKNILTSDEMSYNDIANILNDVDKKDSKYFINILTDIRMKYHEIAYFPNVRILANILGVVDYCENNLLKNKDVFVTLQCVAMLQLVISEGRLANYVNHKDADIRSFARLAYIFCSQNDPYKFLKDDIDNGSNEMYFMLLHYIFGWMMTNNKPIPNFLQYVRTLRDDSSSSFMLKEMSYYSNEDEMNKIIEFLDSEKPKTQSTAIKLCALLSYDKIYEKLIQLYNSSVSEENKVNIIRSLNISGRDKCLQVLLGWYYSSTSKQVSEAILTALISTPSGKIEFDRLKANADDDSKTIFNRIEAIVDLENIKIRNLDNA